MEKQFIYRNSKEKNNQVIILGIVSFLLLSSLVLLGCKLTGIDPAISALINVGFFIVISLFVLSKVRPTKSMNFLLDTQNGVIRFDTREITKDDATHITILKYGTKEDRHVFKLGRLEIDSLNYANALRLVTLLPKVFPNADIVVRKTQSIFVTLVVLGAILSLVMYIVYWVI